MYRRRSQIEHPSCREELAMRDRDESRRQGYGPRGDEAGEPDQWRHREEQDEWRHGSRWMHGSDRGWDRGGGGWRPEDRGGPWEREATGYGPRGGEGYQGGYNMGMNYGQGGPQGQGFGPGQPYEGPGHREGPGGRYPDEPADWSTRSGYGYAGGGPGSAGHSGGGYGGFGGHGYSRGEGSWRQGRWERGPGQGRPPGPAHRRPEPDDRGESLQRGFGMSRYGSYGSREQGAYGGDEERGTWGGSGYQGPSYGAYPATGQRGRPARAPRGYQRSDERIREEICETIIRMGVDAGEVDVKVERGEVTLGGTVDNRHDKRRLEDLAEAVSGVQHVHNQLRIEELQRGQPRSASGDVQPPSGAYGGTTGNAGRGTHQNNRSQ
jgi:hypothetical protein